MTQFDSVYRGKRVLVTGHTGFKGSWLTLWLSQVGGEVTGLALDPKPEAEKLFNIVCPRLTADHRLDICDAAGVAEVVRSCRPDFVFHLAAQPLVIDSYRDPLTTVSTNVSGTANLLNAIRENAPQANTVIVTTDKCYENCEWPYAYRETDHLGGHDIYAASKAAAEIITAAFRRSFFETSDVPGKVATARGGNVIGGGDYADNRIVPDMVKALAKNEPVGVRNPHATRPWQHVLDCLSGYLTLGAWLSSDQADRENTLKRAFNFGPTSDCERSVHDLVTKTLCHWPGSWEDQSTPGAVHEASRLSIAIDLAASILKWSPSWDFSTTVERTVEWYRAESNGNSDSDLSDLMIAQIEAFNAQNNPTGADS